MIKSYRYQVDLTLIAPILSQAAGTRSYGLDTAVLRSPNDQPALPGRLIKGNIRHVWCEFNKLLPDKFSKEKIEIWLGDESKEGSWDEPNPGSLQFDDLWIAQSKPIDSTQNPIQHRITINDDTGAVKPGAFQVIETPYRSGDLVVFTGHITTSAMEENEADILTEWLNKAFGYIPALGALKGSGFGRLDKVDIKQELQSTKKVPGYKDWSNATRFKIILKPDRPFCFARPHSKDSNRFESEDFIPGAAIRGALARHMKQDGVLAKYFEHLHISHALPAKDTKIRPHAIPLSFVFAKDKLYDISQYSKPGLLQGEAPKFKPDWKLKLADLPKRNIQLHTAIDAEFGRSADHDLFALETIQIDDYSWQAELNYQAITDEKERKKFFNELNDLFKQGLTGLGKTKACATIEYAAPDLSSNMIDQQCGKIGQQVILILQSPARLLPNLTRLPSSDNGPALLEAYQQSWNQLSGESLLLSHFYAQQYLAGGSYLQQRFWHERSTYYPELLTSAGSVFVFEVKDKNNTKKLLTQWLKTGLPQQDETHLGKHWRDNPYIAANGYGEIRLRPNDWADLEPQGDWDEC